MVLGRDSLAAGVLARGLSLAIFGFIWEVQSEDVEMNSN